MEYQRLPLEAVTSLLTIPSVAFAIEGIPEATILHVGAGALDWTLGLEDAVSGCVVLGFRTILLDLEEARISSSFEMACIVSAWKLLIEAGGTLGLCCLSQESAGEFARLTEPDLFNVFDDVDHGIEWISHDFEHDLKQKFPRTAKCVECGTAGRVVKRGEHVCDGCGMIYLVTECGELRF